MGGYDKTKNIPIIRQAHKFELADVPIQIDLFNRAWWDYRSRLGCGTESTANKDSTAVRFGGASITLRQCDI